jgi:hypothetical protein
MCLVPRRGRGAGGTAAGPGPGPGAGPAGSQAGSPSRPLRRGQPPPSTEAHDLQTLPHKLSHAIALCVMPGHEVVFKVVT